MNNSVFRSIASSFLLLFIIGCSRFSEKDEHPEYFDAIYKRAGALENLRTNKTLQILDSAYNAFPNPGVGDLFGVDSLKYSALTFIEHDYVKALNYADTMMNIVADRLKEDKYAERYALALYYKGDCYRYMKRYGEALQFYTIAREAVLKYVKNKCAMAAYSGSIANLVFVQQKYQQAAGYFLKQYEDLLYSCNAYTFSHFIDLQACINNVAFSYLKAGLYDSAAYYQDSALNILRHGEHKFPGEYLGIEYAKGVTYRDQADVLLIKGKLAEAEELYKKCIAAVNAAQVDIAYAQSAQAKLAELYFKTGQTDSAGQVLNELKVSLDNFQSEEQWVEWHKLKAKYFVERRKTDSAFWYQFRYDSLRDLAVSRERSFMSTDLAREFENLQLKYSNDILQKESRLRNLYLFVSGIIFLVAAIVAILFFWKNLRRTEKLNLQIQHKNDDLQKAFSSLERSHAENTRIMKIVAHDLKNPISAMKNLAYSLLKKEPAGHQKDALEIIHDSCMNSLALINDLLYEKKNLSQISRERVDVKKLLEQCVELFQAKANEKNQKLQLDAEPVFAFISVEKIWRVISNIINNAIKFSHTDTEINVRLEKKDNYLLLSVRDEGIGIPSQIADKIFSITGEVGRPGTSGEKSHGLGLSISQIIIAEHGGKIWFETEEGKGTVFYVQLPAMD